MRIVSPVVMVLVILVFAGCGSTPEAGADPVAGADNLDTLGWSECCTVSVINPSREEYHLRMLLDDGTVLLDAMVPSRALSMPCVWKRMPCKICGRKITVIVDRQETEAAIAGDTIDVVLDVSRCPAGIVQYPYRTKWN